MPINKKRILYRFNQIFQKYNTSTKLIWATILVQKKILFLNIVSGVFHALTEGLSLGFIFLLSKIISSPNGRDYEWNNLFFLKPFPSLSELLSTLGYKHIVILLISLALFAQIIQSYFKYLNLLTSRYIEAGCLSQVTQKIYKQIFKFSFKYSSQYKVGDLAEHINQCPETIRKQIESLNAITVSSIISITYIFFLLRINYFLFFGIILITFVVKKFQKVLFPIIRKSSNAVTQTKVEISEIMVESFQALRFIYSNGLTNFFQRRMINKTNILEQRLKFRAKGISLVEPILSIVPLLLISLASLLLVLTVERQDIFPVLVTFVIAIQRLNIRIISISNALSNIADNVPRISRLDEIISTQTKEFRRSGNLISNEEIDKIYFSNVEFKYNCRDNFYLKDINFSLNKGEITAFIGKSGSGKSSILDLLVGLYEPNKGYIKVNKNLLSDLCLDNWQKSISVVSQDTFLFNASIKNNLIIGLDKVSHFDIREACYQAGIEDFINGLPKKYETIIGERGFKLSGGQRQRLAIARSLLKKSKLLILDEATSALDSQTELKIQEEIYRLKNDKIIVVVAHRLSTIKDADKIMVLDNGKILETGKHNELLIKKGLYARLWRMQALSK